jgi:hypothetical protein
VSRGETPRQAPQQHAANAETADPAKIVSHRRSRNMCQNPDWVAVDRNDHTGPMAARGAPRSDSCDTGRRRVAHPYRSRTSRRYHIRGDRKPEPPTGCGVSRRPRCRADTGLAGMVEGRPAGAPLRTAPPDFRDVPRKPSAPTARLQPHVNVTMGAVGARAALRARTAGIQATWSNGSSGHVLTARWLWRRKILNGL